MLTKHFYLSYGGESEYDIYDGARKLGRVAIRHFGNRAAAWNGDYWETGILPQIGTVRWESPKQWRDFPPVEVVALFPGFVGARLVFHETTPGLHIQDEGYQLPTVEYQYNGPPPILCPHETVPEYVTFVPAA